MSLALPGIEAELGITKAQLGLFLTLHGLLYGVSKFVNGTLGDRVNPRYFMALGLALSASMNIFFGMSSTALAFGIFWMLNGWFQGMGFPPCARSLTHWFAPRERGTKFAIWNTSHSIGASLILILNSFLVVYSWRLCFYVPAAIALLLNHPQQGEKFPEITIRQGNKTLKISNQSIKGKWAWYSAVPNSTKEKVILTIPAAQWHGQAALWVQNIRYRQPVTLDVELKNPAKPELLPPLPWPTSEKRDYLKVKEMKL